MFQRNRSTLRQYDLRCCRRIPPFEIHRQNLALELLGFLLCVSRHIPCAEEEPESRHIVVDFTYLVVFREIFLRCVADGAVYSEDLRVESVSLHYRRKNIAWRGRISWRRRGVGLAYVVVIRVRLCLVGLIGSLIGLPSVGRIEVAPHAPSKPPLGHRSKARWRMELPIKPPRQRLK